MLLKVMQTIKTVMFKTIQIMQFKIIQITVI